MKKILLIAIAAMMLVACKSHQVSMDAFYPTKCEYLNSEGDGSITVRAYGSGRNNVDAFAQARKNALQEVIFKGIAVPGNAYLSRPLIMEVNAEEKYAEFFNAFFADNGPYEEFVSKQDRRLVTNEKEFSGTQKKTSTTVRVLRSQLQKYLKENNIIK
jgi:hypothetical protein